MIDQRTQSSLPPQDKNGRRDLPNLDRLTSMERALLDKLCEGLTFRQVDRALHLEEGTAHRIRKYLFRKIGVRTRHEASAAAHPTCHIKPADLKRHLEDRYGLSKRECDVLTLMLYAPELSRRQVGEQLGMSDNTTRLTINRVNKKLGVRTRAEAVYTIRISLQRKDEEDETSDLPSETDE